jgi:cyclic pyranopterin phosphate synthase
MPLNGVQKMEHKDILTLEEIENIAKIFCSLGIKKIRITGGEPLLRKGVFQLFEKLGKFNELDEILLTTNGILLSEYAQKLRDVGVTKINISIDTFDEAKYFDLTGGGDVKKVLDGIEKAKKIGFESIKLNVVLIKGINDDEIEKFVNLTKYEKIDVRFIELMPVGDVCGWAKERFISNKIILEKMDGLKKIYNSDISSPAVYYKLENSKGRVGLISSFSGKFCDSCNRVRLSADGKIKMCLHSDEEIDIKNMLRNNVDITEKIKEIIFNKPKSHALERGEYSKKSMFQIGG